MSDGAPDVAGLAIQAVRYLYAQVPALSTIVSTYQTVYGAASYVPYLPFLLTLLSVYVAFYTVYSTLRTVMRTGTLLVKYGTLVGSALALYSYIQGTVETTPAVQGQGRKGADYWANRPPRANVNGATRGKTSDWKSMLLNFVDPPAKGARSGTRTTRSSSKKDLPETPEFVNQAARFVLGKAVHGESLVGAVWEQLKESAASFVETLQQPGAEEGRRSTKSSKKKAKR